MNHVARIDRRRMAAPQVYRYLHGQIVSGEFRPGHALSENAVAVQLNVSRTPVLHQPRRGGRQPISARVD